MLRQIEPMATARRLHVDSEVGTLRRVVLLRPDLELRRLRTRPSTPWPRDSRPRELTRTRSNELVARPVRLAPGEGHRRRGRARYAGTPA
jgi:hypothetical protein